ncbi:MAG: hypothetical protein AAF066_15185 [Pseudomonadota bacterium]
MHTTVVLVTGGYMAGRILYSDDDGIEFREQKDFSSDSLADEHLEIVWDKTDPGEFDEAAPLKNGKNTLG